MRKPALSRSTPSMAAALATPSPRIRSASVPKARPAWLTMKPGVSLARTGWCPMALTSSRRRSPTSTWVARPSITSTRRISGTGLKKCRPATRPGWRQAEAIAVIDSDEVLLARMVSASSTSSSWRNSACLASRFSTMASTTTWQPCSASRLPSTCRLPTARSAASAVSRPFSTSLARIAAMPSRARCAAPGRTSNRQARSPACTAIWAMPCPMAPVPTMPTQVIG
ncbi:hypothetical protein D3C78_756490 [compost metagenome]